jgi:hypothetical protein
MSYDLIELTLSRLGDRLPKRLSPCLESHQTDSRSARQCTVKRPAGSAVDKPNLGALSRTGEAHGDGERS